MGLVFVARVRAAPSRHTKVKEKLVKYAILIYDENSVNPDPDPDPAVWSYLATPASAASCSAGWRI